MTRMLEEMLVEIISGVYKPLPNYKYVGPTHLSIGQEAVSTGSVAALGLNDYITSSHRGHGDALAKGYWTIKYMSNEGLREFLAKREKFASAIGKPLNLKEDRNSLEETALKVHIYRMVAELFGKADGYCSGVGGGMHIADFSIGHLGANAIVGGHMGIAVGAAISGRYQKNNKVVLCLAGDGAYSNGISHESMNLATMAQFNNGLMSDKFGVPIIFAIVNNQYAMSGQEKGEITGIDYLARRGASYDLNNMNAEVVDGMDILAVYDAVRRASTIARDGKAPVLLEFITYRFKGHSLSDPLSYRSREESTSWQERDPINSFIKRLVETVFPDEPDSKITLEEIEALKEKAYKRNSEMAVKAAHSLDPDFSGLTKHVYAGEIHIESKKRNNFQKSNTRAPVNAIPNYKRNEKGELSYRLAIREALIEEMIRNDRVIL
ncbi:MAG: thiamine pyrophosphate-dependent dehydrogenase E1 component subunit alpha, partial [Actinobacteria bacterium]|nr:thiamine pyrophosphate-dependent dehydrogenase E1 component subunit alpha [Actinomycetota bacterium]